MQRRHLHLFLIVLAVQGAWHVGAARADELGSIATAEKTAQARQQLYLADIRTADIAWREGNIPLMESLLRRHVPNGAEADLRQFEWYVLWGFLQRNRPQRRVELPDHLKAAAFSPTGDDLAVVLGSDHSVIMIDAGTGELRQRYDQAAPSRWRKEFLAFSPDGNTLAYQGKSDRIVRLRNLVSGQVQDLPRSDGYIYSAAFSPTDDLLVTGSSNGIIQVWDLQTNKRRVLERFGAAINALAFSPGGKQLAVGCRASSHFGAPLTDGVSHKTAKVIQLADGEVRYEVHHNGAVNALAFSPDGRFLATGGSDGVLQVYDFRDDSVSTIWRAELSERGDAVGGRIRSLAFSPDSRWLAAGGIGLRVWDTSHFKLAATLGGHVSPIQGVSFSANNLLASVGLDHTVLVWDLNQAGWTGAETRDFGGKVDTVAFCPNGEIAVHTLGSSRLPVWDPVSDRVRHIEGAGHYAVSKSGVLAAATRENIRFVDLMTGEKAETPLGVNVTQLAFSPNDDVLALATYQGAVQLWSAQTGEPILQSGAQQGRVSDLVFSPDGKRVASAHQLPYHVTVWDVVAREKELTLDVGSGSGELAVDFSPDGNLLAVGRQFLGIQIWNLKEPEKLPIVLPAVTMAVAFAPSGQTLFSGRMGDAALHVWDLPTRRLKCSLPGVSRTRDIAVSSDGTMVAVGGWDGTVRLLRAVDVPDRS